MWNVGRTDNTELEWRQWSLVVQDHGICLRASGRLAGVPAGATAHQSEAPSLERAASLTATRGRGVCACVRACASHFVFLLLVLIIPGGQFYGAEFLQKALA
jgi:hypothetical protein